MDCGTHSSMQGSSNCQGWLWANSSSAQGRPKPRLLAWQCAQAILRCCDVIAVALRVGLSCWSGLLLLIVSCCRRVWWSRSSWIQRLLQNRSVMSKITPLWLI